MSKGITNVFAEFYKDLYSKKNDEIKTTNGTAKQDLKTLVTILTMILKTVSKTELTRKELMIAIDRLKKVESATARKQSRSHQRS